MGWNNWYTHYDRVTERTCARPPTQMIATGMADFGYQYVNIDDCWMVKPRRRSARSAARRATRRHILPNATLPRHEGTGRLHPRQGAEGRHLHLARPADLRRLRRELPARGAGRAARSPTGASTSSSTTGAPTASVAGGNEPRTPAEALPADVRPSCRSRTATSSSTSASTAWATSGSGAARCGHCWRTTGDLGLGARRPPARLLRDRLQQRPALGTRPARRWNDPDYLLIG